MLRKNDLDELLKDGILVDNTADHYNLDSIGSSYKVADGYEIFVLCEDDENTWEKVVDISYNRQSNNVYISNDNYWLENIIKIKIMKMVKHYE